jgi:N6-L-threonylcarbamoyladenine synthase
MSTSDNHPPVARNDGLFTQPDWQVSESPRLVVALDTASENIALAIGRRTEDGGIALVAADDHPAVRQANVRLMPALDALFRENDLARQDVACVVCGLGPGSFTGVRIGVATAKGLARGLGVPLFGVSTLDAVAWGAWLEGVRGSVGVVADAMRKEVYPARFELDDKGVRRLDPHTVAKVEEVIARWGETTDELILIGDGLRKYAETFAGQEGVVLGDSALWTPQGIGLLRAFESAYSLGLAGNGEAGALLPVYTRLSDAEENERKRLALGGRIAQGALVEVPLSGVADPARLMVFRPLAAEDLNQVSALERDAFPVGARTSGECWTPDMFADDLARKDRIWWVAYVDDLLVGFAGAWLVDGVLQILDVAVVASHRRQGIASELLNRLMNDARDLGASSISLEVRESNEEAQALYTSLGFTRLGVRPRYYSSRSGAARESAIIMVKDLEKAVFALPAAASATSPAAASAASPTVTPSALPAPVILAIETSCDETAAAIIDGEGRLLSNVIASQVDFHARFGGVVPEIASRKHTEAIVGVVDAALEKARLVGWQALDALAVTYAPGLIGALVVGVAFAKGLAWATGLPLIRVNHLEGHIYANRLEAVDPDDDIPPTPTPPLAPPFVAALLSGGHTMLVEVRDWGAYRVLGQTLDDAVGEAFDKVAKALGLGYPGGPVISRLAEQGDPAVFNFPRALLHSHDYRFSLSGLKTAVITFIRKEQEANRPLDIPGIAASFQQAVIDVQVAKALTALEETGCRTFCVGGGVAANKALRDAYETAMAKRGIRVVFPLGSACTDNAAMIARVALDRFHRHRFMRLDDDAFAQADLELAY